EVQRQVSRDLPVVFGEAGDFINDDVAEGFLTCQDALPFSVLNIFVRVDPVSLFHGVNGTGKQIQQASCVASQRRKSSGGKLSGVATRTRKWRNEAAGARVNARRGQVRGDVAVALGGTRPVLAAKFEGVFTFRPTQRVCVRIQTRPVAVVRSSEVDEASGCTAAKVVIGRTDKRRTATAARPDQDWIRLSG